MHCLHLNIRQATFIILTIIINNINIIRMAENNLDTLSKNSIKKDESPKEISEISQVPAHCQSNTTQCSQLNPTCLLCDFNYNCRYGDNTTVVCHVNESLNCIGARRFERQMLCRYCYQTEHWEHVCELKANCNSIGSPRVNYTTNCTVKSHILCLGERTFNKNILCNWTSGYRWITALILSITLGGFGADRFYLGHWQEGIGKLFSFGGLGVWTIIDVILISLHYLGPADGSLYI